MSQPTKRRIQLQGGKNLSPINTFLKKNKQSAATDGRYPNRRIISILVKAGCQALIEIYNPELDLVAAKKSVYRYLASLG